MPPDEFNIILALTYAFVGCAAEWLSMRQPTPGEVIGHFIQICGVALFLGAAMPTETNTLIIMALVAAKIGRVLGRILSEVIDALRVHKEKGSYETSRERPQGSGHQSRSQR